METQQARSELMNILADFETIDGKTGQLTKNFSRPPIPVCDIARDVGIEVYRIDFKDFKDMELAGVCDMNNGKIYVNRDDSLLAQIFTIAHEIGHWVLHRDEIREENLRFSYLPKSRNRDFDEIPMENDADEFAVNLLMPKELVRKYRFLRPAFLAEAFNVEQDVMERRLQSV